MILHHALVREVFTINSFYPKPPFLKLELRSTLPTAKGILAGGKTHYCISDNRLSYLT